MSEGVLYVDNDDLLQFTNNRFCELLGYSNEELNGKKGTDFLLPEEDKKRMIEINNNRKKGIISSYEIKLKTKAGKGLWMHINGSPVIDKNGNVIGSMGTHTDITEKKKVEHELHESLERFNHATHASNEIIYDWVIDKDEVWWNDSYYKLTGEQKQNEWLQKEGWQNLIHNDDQKRVMSSVNHFLESNENYWSSVYRYIDKNGNLFYLKNRAYVLRNKDGHAYRMIGALIDITPLKQYAIHLEEIIFSLSHKLRQPVAHILGVSNLLETSRNSEEELLKISGFMKQSAISLDTFSSELTVLVSSIKDKF